MGRKFVYGGVRDTLTGHARRLGIPLSTLFSRIYRYGNNPEFYDVLLCRYSLSQRRTSVVGKSINIADLCRRAGVCATTVYSRLRCGATLEQALYKGSWHRMRAVSQPAHGNHTRRKLAALGIFA